MGSGAQSSLPGELDAKDAMNFTLANLAVELLLFAAAWTAVGISIREHRPSCFSWAVGWLMIGVAAALMFARPLTPLLALDIPINFLLLTAFLQLQRGLCQLGNQTPHPAFMMVTYLGLFLIELARWFQPGAHALFAWIFALTLAIPVGGIMVQLRSHAPEWFRRRRAGPYMLAIPLALTVLALMVRAWMMGATAAPSHYFFENATGYIIATTTAFQVFLGLFNYSLFALVLGTLIQRLDNLSSQDQLTGLFNRRVMLDTLAQAHAQYLLDRQPYALVMMDLDNFKQVNDRFGHLAGDKALRTLARRLRGAVRTGDFVARFGGDDFMVLMPQTELAEACKRAEQLRAAIAGEPISTARGAVSLTMSIGVTLARQPDVGTAPALARVDNALQQARRQGRNCLRVA